MSRPSKMPWISLLEASRYMPDKNMSQEMIRIAQQVVKVSKDNSLAGHLRSTKPKDGEAAYVWRMVAFNVSPIRQHQCMPVTAEFDMPAEYWDRTDTRAAAEKRRNRCKELDVLVDALVNSVPKEQWHGVVRWGRALGQL